jgi:ubiquinone/menaquinone biosynthesis C-methylase UbiE
MTRQTGYIPALGVDWLTPLYDPVLKWVMQEDRFKCDLVQRAALQPGQRVLDLGCGTGTLTIMLKQAQPDAILNGIDGDDQVLTIARAKCARASVEVDLTQGMVFDLPYPNGLFDRAVTSLVVHHLTRSQKQRTFAEIFRVLCSGGELYMMDFGEPHTPLAGAIGQIMRRFEQVADNIDGLLPEFMRSVGFNSVKIYAHYMTIFGTLTLLGARKPGWPDSVG